MRCLRSARTLHIEDTYGLAPGKDASFLVLDAPLPFEAIRQRAGVLRLRAPRRGALHPRPGADAEQVRPARLSRRA
ncbi:MAG: hypothetical protein II093_09915 [Selenomonas sp.]|nr:hypothetical protein [Selenomonas sp.]